MLKSLPRKPIALLFIRIVVGIVFMAHGIQKLQGIENVAGFFGMIHIPAPHFMAWVVALVETFGGLALILGAFTWIAASLLAFIMVVAILTAKLHTQFIGGWEFDATLFATLVGVALMGAGRYSVDAKMCGSCGCHHCSGASCQSGCSCPTPDANKKY
jgi:uncharacterized membrane protein YphA (DoxX/SURF4 family)